jgi:hypothetical protein
MSTDTSNAPTKGYSGKFGDDLVFRRVNGVSLMAKPPDRSGTSSSPAREQQKEEFRRGAEDQGSGL